MPEGDPQQIVGVDSAFLSNQGVLVLGWHNNWRTAMPFEVLPPGPFAIGDRIGRNFVWGNEKVVSGFMNQIEKVVRLDCDFARPSASTAPAGLHRVWVSILNTRVRFHPGHQYNHDLGAELQIAVVTAEGNEETGDRWELHRSSEGWPDDAVDKIVAEIDPAVRIVFGALGGLMEQFAPAMARRSAGKHCCVIARGPVDAQGENTEGNAVWFCGPHSMLHAPANVGADAAHELAAPAGGLPVHGRPLRVSMYRTVRDSPDMTSLPIVYLGKSHAQGMREAGRAKERRKEKQRAGRGGAASSSKGSGRRAAAR